VVSNFVRGKFQGKRQDNRNKKYLNLFFIHSFIHAVIAATL